MNKCQYIIRFHDAQSRVTNFSHNGKNFNGASGYENCVASATTDNVPESESPKSSISLVNKEEVTHIYTNQVMEIEDAMNESITVEVETEETLEKDLVVLDNHEFQRYYQSAGGSARVFVIDHSSR